jgi:hypothetical protein
VRGPRAAAVVSGTRARTTSRINGAHSRKSKRGLAAGRRAWYGAFVAEELSSCGYDARPGGTTIHSRRGWGEDVRHGTAGTHRGRSAVGFMGTEKRRILGTVVASRAVGERIVVTIQLEAPIEENDVNDDRDAA